MVKHFKIIIILLGRHLVLFPTGMWFGEHVHVLLSRGLVSQREFKRSTQSLSFVQSPPITVK
jgi:hypothetical protein